MGVHTEQALRQSLSLLRGGGESLAAVRELERRINSLYREIEAAAIDSCSLPLNSDNLRLLLNSVKISIDLERIANHALWISEFAHSNAGAIDLSHGDELIALLEKIVAHLNLTLRMIADEEAVQPEALSDHDLTKKCERIMHALLRMMARALDGNGIPSDAFLVCRALDRIADLLLSIAHETAGYRRAAV